MCGRFEQSETRRYYAAALGVDTSNRLEWMGGDQMPVYNVAPGRCPWMIMLREGKPHFIGMTWGYRTLEEAAANRKAWINARIEKALTGRYFRQCSGKGAGSSLQVAGLSGQSRTARSSLGTSQGAQGRHLHGRFIQLQAAGLYASRQTVDVGFVIVTEDCEGGMVDTHDRPVVLAPEDAQLWMDPEIPVEEAARIAQSRSLGTEEFVWWKVDRAVNRADPYNNGKHLIAAIET